MAFPYPSHLLPVLGFVPTIGLVGHYPNLALCDVAGNVDEHKWESFTLTMRSPALLDRIARDTGNEPGTGGLTTFFESGWHLTLHVPKQPHFMAQPQDTSVLYGYGFEIDGIGDYVTKPMSESTGREVLTELLGQLGFDDIRDHVLATTDVTTTMMPYA